MKILEGHGTGKSNLSGVGLSANFFLITWRIIDRIALLR